MPRRTLPTLRALAALTPVGVTGAAALALTRAVGDSRLRAERDRLQGAVALVAGGSRGLGLALCEELAGHGLRVVTCARDAEELGRAQAQLRAAGHELHTRVCDVSVRDRVHGLVAGVEADLGPVEVLVSVAGSITVGPAAAVTVEDIEANLASSFWGGVYLSQEVLPGMRERGRGHIAAIASIGGRIAPPHLLPYAAAKFASVGYHEGLRQELSGTGVRVTTVFPGLMRTGSHVHAQFLGRKADEYAWFAVGASLPGVAMDPRRAARRIARAVLLGRAELQLPAYTHVLTRVHGVMPATTQHVLGLAGRLLPGAEGPPRWTWVRTSGLLRHLTSPGAEAGTELNQEGAAR